MYAIYPRWYGEEGKNEAACSLPEDVGDRKRTFCKSKAVALK